MLEQFRKVGNEMTDKVMLSVELACQRILDLGYAKAGHNGPYGNPETPMRNTAHWLMSFSYAFQITSKEDYLEAVKVCADYLSHPSNRPKGAAFLGSGLEGGKWDGLIGQAWVIEALCQASKLMGQKRYLEIAKEVFFMHEFDQSNGLWKKLSVDGDVLSVDTIVHHQLWFAAAGGVLANATKDQMIRLRVDLFLEKLEGNLLFYRDGLIMQRTVPRKLTKGSVQFMDKGLGQVKRGLVNPLLGKGLRHKENGYHLTNLYAFAMLKEAGFGKEFFQASRFQKSLDYGFSEAIIEAFEDSDQKKDRTGPPLGMAMPANRYAYAYNAPGFAMPYVYHAFRDLLPASAMDRVREVMDRQMKITYDKEEGKFSRNTEDAETLNARVCLFLRYIS